jgi:hypothetical protein
MPTPKNDLADDDLEVPISKEHGLALSWGTSEGERQNAANDPTRT